MPVTEKKLRSRDVTEHRWGQRIALEVPVKLEFGGRPMGHGLLRSASISGGFIDTTLELPIFSNLVVVLPANSEAAPNGARLAGCLLRREPAGLAVEWRDMGCPAIASLLEKVSGRSIADLRDDEAFAPRRKSCAFAS
jgi:hypothetical protein